MRRKLPVFVITLTLALSALACNLGTRAASPAPAAESAPTAAQAAAPTAAAPAEAPPAATVTPLPTELPPTATPVPFLPAGLAPLTAQNAPALTELTQLPAIEVVAAAFSPDGRYLATVTRRSDDRQGLVNVWDLTSGDLLFTLEGWDRAPAIAFSPDGATLATFTAYNTLAFWSVPGGEMTASLKGSYDALAFAPDWSRMAALAYDSADDTTTIRFLTLDGQEANGGFATAGMGLGMTFSPDGAALALTVVSNMEVSTEVWDAAKGERITTLPGISDLTFTPDGRRAAGRYRDGEGLRVFDAAWNPLFAADTGDGTTSMRPPALSPDGRLLAAGYDYSVVVWDVENAGELITLPDEQEALLSPDGLILLTWQYQGPPRIWGVLP